MVADSLFAIVTATMIIAMGIVCGFSVRKERKLTILFCGLLGVAVAWVLSFIWIALFITIFAGVMASIVFYSIYKNGAIAFWCGVFGFLLVFLALMVSWSYLTPFTIESSTERVDLVAIDYTAGTSGTFFLASGHFEDQDYYVFRYLIGPGKTLVGRVNAQVVSATEQEGLVDSGYINFTRSYKIRNLDLWQQFVFQGIKNREQVGGVGEEIYVPKGSIQRSVNLDLK